MGHAPGSCRRLRWSFFAYLVKITLLYLLSKECFTEISKVLLIFILNHALIDKRKPITGMGCLEFHYVGSQ